MDRLTNQLLLALLACLMFVSSCAPSNGSRSLVRGLSGITPETGPLDGDGGVQDPPVKPPPEPPVVIPEADVPVDPVNLESLQILDIDSLHEGTETAFIGFRKQLTAKVTFPGLTKYQGSENPVKGLVIKIFSSDQDLSKDDPEIDQMCESSTLLSAVKIDQTGSGGLLTQQIILGAEAKDRMLAEGLHYFYGYTENSEGDISDCMPLLTATFEHSYERVACPEDLGSMVVVRGLAATGTPKDFCVMKYEAKNVNGKARSIPGQTPWLNVSDAEAIKACGEINPEGSEGEFHLVTNSEWMTMARDLELQSKNWTGLEVGKGKLVNGHSALTTSLTSSSRTATLAASGDDQDGLYGINPPSAERRRTFYLSTGEWIWDVAGNAAEIVNWSDHPELKSDSTVEGWQRPICGQANNFYFNHPASLYCSTSYKTNLQNSIAPARTYSISDNTNRFGLGVSFAHMKAGTVLRGGGYTSLWGTVSGGVSMNTYSLWAGLYSLAIIDSSDVQRKNIIGFRCAYQLSKE